MNTKKCTGAFFTLSVVLLVFSAYPLQTDSTLLSRLAKVYDYGSLHNVSIQTDKATIIFSDKKTGKIKIVKQLPLFDNEKTVMVLDSEKMLRKAFVTSNVDTGVFKGLYDVAGMLSNIVLDSAVGTEKIKDTAYYRLSIADFKRPWFLVSLFQPNPVWKVKAVLHVQEKTLQIRKIDVTVIYGPNETGHKESYVISLDNYSKINGVWIPRDYFATLTGFKEGLTEESKKKMLAADLDNPGYTNYIIQKYKEYIDSASDPKKKIQVENKSKEFIFGFRTLRYNIGTSIAKGKEGYNLHVTKINSQCKSDASFFQF